MPARRSIALGMLLLTVSAGSAKPLPAGKATIQQSIMDELKELPAAGPFTTKPAAHALPELFDKELGLYKADYASLAGLKKLVAEAPKKYPLRTATLKAMDALRETDKCPVMLTFSLRPTAKEKGRFLNDQKDIAFATFTLHEFLEELDAADKQRSTETLPRWQAHFDFVRLACLIRLVFLYEYNYVLGDIRADRLPELPPELTGWRLVAVDKLSTSEVRAKTMVRQLNDLADKIQKDHPNTPWFYLARSERQTPRGLEWRAAR